MTFRIDFRAIRRRIAHNFLWKVASTVFAIGLWAFVNLGARETDKGLSVPLDLRNVPANYMIISPVPETVAVRVRGPRTILGSIDDRRLRISLELANVRPGTTSFKIDADMLSLPRGVRVTRVSPVQVTLDVEKVVRRALPVTVNFATATPAGFRLIDSEIHPAIVTVTGPANEVEAMKSVPVASLRLAPSAGDFEQFAPIERPSGFVQLSPDKVAVRGRLEEIVVDEQYRNVTVGARNSQGAYRVRPSTADVVIRGPQRLLRAFKPSAENVYVDLNGLERGSRTEKITVALPQGLEAIQVKPSQVTATVTPEPNAGKSR